MRKIRNNNDKKDNLLSLGKSYCKNKEYEKAIKTLLEFAKLNPNNSECLYYLGRSYNEIDE